MSYAMLQNVRIVDSTESSDLIIDLCFSSLDVVNAFSDGIIETLKAATLEYHFDWFSFIREPLPEVDEEVGLFYALTLRRWYSPNNRRRLCWRPFVEREVRDGVHPLCSWLGLLLESALIRYSAPWKGQQSSGSTEVFHLDENGDVKLLPLAAFNEVYPRIDDSDGSSTHWKRLN